MKVRAVVMLLALAWAATGVAQEAPLVEPTPDLTRVKLLDEVPNYGVVLADQWRNGSRLDDLEIGRSGANYGRLVEVGDVRSMTLQECIALALDHNTGLKVQRLDPIFSAAEVRRVRSIFDPQFYGDVSKTYQTDAPNTLSVLTTGSGPAARRTCPCRPCCSTQRQLRRRLSQDSAHRRPALARLDQRPSHAPIRPPSFRSFPSTRRRSACR